MAKFTVRINGEDHSFTSANNLRRYVMRYGVSGKKYTYHGEGGMFIDEYGVMSLSNGIWKVKLKSGTVVNVDKKTGQITEDGRYKVKYTATGESVTRIRSYNNLDEAVRFGVTMLARNRKSKVQVYDGDKRIGTIGAKDNYPVWRDVKTKKTYDIYTNGKIAEVTAVPEKPKAKPKAVIKYVILGRKFGNKTYKYYAGEGFTTKKEYAFKVKTVKEAEKVIEELSWMGDFDGYEYKIDKIRE